MSSNPHQGGDLADMAKEGTSIPNDAGKQRVIPSVPNPHQAAESDNVVDNPTDIPRNPGEPGAAGETFDANTGKRMPAFVEKKQGKAEGADNPLARGNPRDDKHTRDKQSHLDAEAQAGHEVVPAPGEEGEDQETIRERKGA